MFKLNFELPDSAALGGSEAPTVTWLRGQAVTKVLQKPLGNCCDAGLCHESVCRDGISVEGPQ